MTEEIRLLLRNITSQWLLQSTRLIVGFITTVFIARILGPEGYGIIALASIFITLFNFIADLGFKNSVIRYISVYSGSRKDYICLVAGFLTYKILVGSSLALAFYILAPHFASVAGTDNYINVFRLLSLSIFLSSVSSALRAFLHGIRNVYIANLCYSIGFIIGSISSVILVFIGYGVFGYVLGLVISDTIQFFMYVFVSREVIKKCIKINPIEALKSLKAVFPLSLALSASQFLNFLYGWFDKVLILNLLNTYGLGLYSIALRFASIFDVGREAMFAALTPYYGHIYAAKGLEALRSRIRKVSKLVIATYTPLTLIVAMLTPMLIPLLYGQEFTGAWPIAFAHLIYIAFTSFTVAYGGITLIVEARKEIIMSSIIRTIGSIFLEFLLITIGLEALGVIIGKDIGALLSFLYLYFILFRKLKLLLDLKSISLIIPIEMVPAFTLLATAMSNMYLYINTLVLIFTHLTLLKAFKLVDRTDIKVLKEALGSRYGKIMDVLEKIV